MRMFPICGLGLACLLGLAPDDSPRLTEGRFGQALDARSGGYIAPPDSRFEERPLTIELWARLLDRDAGGVLLSHESPTSGTHWELAILPGTSEIGFVSSGQSPRMVVADGPLGDGQWHHVTVQVETTRVRILIDGILQVDQEVSARELPSQRSGLGVGTRIEDRTPNEVLIDEVRITREVRDLVVVPEVALVKDAQTILLLDFDESESEYLARWTPGGETNQAGLPYPHRYAAYEFETDDNWIDDRWQATQKGPFVTHSTQLPQHQVGPKTMTLFLGENQSTVALFDLERCSVISGLTEATWKTDPMRFGLLRKPSLEGDLQFYVPPSKAWLHPPASGEADPKPLDRSEIDYQGLQLHGQNVVLTSKLLGGKVDEVCAEIRRGEVVAIDRRIRIENLAEPVWLTLAEFPTPSEIRNNNGLSLAISKADDGTSHAIAVRAQSGSGGLSLRDNDVILPINTDSKWSGDVLFWAGPSEQLGEFLELAQTRVSLPDMNSLRQPGPRRWGEPIVTKGSLGEENGESPYLIDTISVPFDNPFGALLFITALDFFPNGDAALATAHGDVWIVRGLDRSLDAVSWQRFATGLYQPLGLKVVDEKVVVLGRDQLTMLHDQNNDGEADLYESLNNDLIIEGVDHAFAMRLETDPQGNFYFLKSGSGPHGSALIKVTADGSELSVFRAGVSSSLRPRGGTRWSGHRSRQ